MSNVEELVREARDIDAQIRELTEQKSALIEKIKAQLSIGEKVVVDGVAASLRIGNRKFDTKTALGMMDEDTRLKCVVQKIDEKLVRQFAEAMGIAEAAMIAPDPSKTVFNLTS